MEDKPRPRNPYPSDISDEEWAFVAPYLTLMTPTAPQRKHELREVFNATRWIVRAGPVAGVADELPAVGSGLSTDGALDQRRGLRRDDPRSARTVALDRRPRSRAVIFDSTTRQSTPESEAGAGYDGYKWKNGSKVHLAVDTLGRLLTLQVTPANAQDRERAVVLAEAVQEATGQTVEVAFVDQGYTGEAAREAASQQRIDLVMVKLAQAKRGFVLLPRRWVVERSFAWATRFRRLTKDYDRLPETVSCSINYSISQPKVHNSL